MPTPLDMARAAYMRLREQLQAEYGLADDDEALLDSLEGECDLPDMLIRLVRQAKDREASAEACKAQIEALTARKRRHADAAEKLRALVAETMLEATIKRLAPGDFCATAKWTKARPVVVDDAALPSFYLRTETKTVPDTECIKGEYDRCQAEGGRFDIPGVAISNGRPSLTIRT